MKEKYTIEKAQSGFYESLPRPTQKQLDEFYTNLYYGDGVTDTYPQEYSEIEIKQKKLRADCTVELLSQNIESDKKNISALEIGSGEGFVIKSCMMKGWKIKGVDYQVGPIEKLNPDVIKNFLEADPNIFLQDAIKNNDRYDVIILQNVLEHVIDPEKMFKQLLSIVETNGSLLIQVPDDFSDLQKLAKEQKIIDKDYWICPPQHLNYFNSKNFENFVKSNGGHIVDAITDFPIEMYLWGNKSNYVTDKSIGNLSHMARVNLDVFISRSGIKNYVDFYRSLYKVGLGRNVIAVIKNS
tara:strand:- start:2564 stop:3454 length:891 start_codon:yes stop_codon:yes gene_type:complete